MSYTSTRPGASRTQQLITGIRRAPRKLVIAGVAGLAALAAAAALVAAPAAHNATSHNSSYLADIFVGNDAF